MTRRDLGWRGAGLLLTGLACAAAVRSDTAAAALLLPLALLGLPLIFHGKHVGQAIRAGRHGHPRTAQAIHAARRRGRGG